MKRPAITPQRMRELFLEVVHEFAEKGNAALQSITILPEVRRRLTTEGQWDPHALMTLWSDMFLQGVLGWGYDVDNCNPPFLHLTERGRRTLEHLSRDPMNPDGYRAHLAKHAELGAVAMSYVAEALTTFNSACYKATAVMVGCAAESLVLDLRNAVEARIKTHNRSVSSNLTDWRVLTVLKALQTELEKHKAVMPKDLREQFEGQWPSFIQQIRAARNDAGHPSSIDSVTPEDVHATLLIFPAVARLAVELTRWVTSSMP